MPTSKSASRANVASRSSIRRRAQGASTGRRRERRHDAPAASARSAAARRSAALFYWCAVLGLWALIVCGGAIVWVAANLPPIHSLEIPRRPPSIEIVGNRRQADRDARTAAGQPIGLQPHEDGSCSVKFRWSEELSAEYPSSDAFAASLGVISRGTWRVYPSLDGGSRPIHPLLVWWAILFRLSMLARYRARRPGIS